MDVIKRTSGVCLLFCVHQENDIDDDEEEKMSGATYSAEQLILRGLAEINCSLNVFSALAGVCSASTLSKALSGQSELGGNESQKLLRCLDEMKCLAGSVSPVPVNWSKVGLIREILQRRRGLDYSADRCIA